MSGHNQEAISKFAHFFLWQATQDGANQVEFAIEGARAPQLLAVHVRDLGDGIPHLQSVLDGNYRSATGMGLGIVGARRLMDHFAIQATAKGSTVTLH